MLVMCFGVFKTMVEMLETRVCSKVQNVCHCSSVSLFT